MPKDVAVRALELPFKYLARRGVDIEPLLHGLSCPPSTFKRRRDWIDWADFCSLLSRIRDLLGTSEELTEIGHALLATGVWLPLKLIMRTIVRQESLYRWVSDRGTRLMFSSLKTSFADQDGARVFTVIQDESLPICDEYFWVTKGVLEAMPQMLGYPSAVVEMERRGHTGIYRIALAPNRRLRDRAASFIRKLGLNRATAALELERSLTLLEHENRELAAAKQTIQRQAAQIEAVERLGRDLAVEVEPVQIAEATVRVLVENVQLAWAALYVLSVDGAGLRLARSRGAEAVRLPDKAGSELELEAWTARLAEVAAVTVTPLCESDDRLVGCIVSAASGSTDLELFRALQPHLTIAAKHLHAYEEIHGFNRELERKVEERTLELVAMVDELQEAMASRERLFANLNHEFRTPITLMLLPLERLLGMPLLAQHRTQLSGIETNARKLLRLVNGLMELAASREGRLRLRLEWFDAVAFAEEAVNAYLPAAEQLSIRLLVVPSGAVMLHASREALGRILDNLLGNALKYTKPGGEVRVSVRALGERVELAVEDTGIGIPEADRDRIFERFERSGEPVHPGQTGVGIGLSLVKTLTEWHGGHVGVESESGRGSRFWVNLPAEATEAALARQDRRGDDDAPIGRRRGADAAPHLRARATPAPSLSLRTESVKAPVEPPSRAPTLLVVEDNPELREVLLLSLEGRYRVIVAANGVEGLRLAQETAVDLVLSDLMMPEMDGIELCRRLKATPGRDLVPFVLLTANQDRDTLVRALGIGADDFLVKPFNEPELIARVQAQLRIRELARRVSESERLATVGRMLSGMAHELRNPINVLVNGLLPLREELLEAGTLGPATEELLRAIEDASQRVNALTEELLSFHRPAATRGRVRLGDLVEKSLGLLKPKLGQVQVQTSLAFEGDVEGSPHSLGQVLVNLVENALHAVKGEGRVGIESRASDGAVELDVWDDGPGIPEGDRQRIFEPFFTTKPPGQGTGLGLAISRQIVERHGGQLILAPSEKGARFRLTLPPAS
ncbi:MAG: ATP-binding protein [Deltaproteobacteria bacterium]